MPVLTDPLVSVGLPVRNGADRIVVAAQSVLTQEYQNLELVISDNASTDDTEQVCRALARADPRVVYHRQPQDMGLLANFENAMRLARGEYFRWLSDDDALAPDYVQRCLDAYRRDDRLILVTSQMAYAGPDGSLVTASYRGSPFGPGLRSEDPIERLAEMLRLLNSSHLLIDPLYALLRRAAIAAIPRRNMLREDEIFACRMALAGPWDHVGIVLSQRHWKHDRPFALARRLGVPLWHSRIATVLQCRELLRHIAEVPLTSAQRRRAQSAVVEFYLRRHARSLARRGRRVAREASNRLRLRRG